MNAIPIGTSALSAAQRGLDLVGQNLANALTPGYSRQTLNLVSRTTGPDIGTGVEVARYVRSEAPNLRTAIRRSTSDEAAFAVRADARRQIETSFGIEPNTISTQLDNFFGQIEGLTTRPADAGLRRIAISNAENLAQQINTVAGDIDRFRFNLNQDIERTVGEVNQFTTQIANLNREITLIESRGDQANDLQDQRDQLINQLSERINIRTIPQPFGVVNVLAENSALVVGDTPIQFETTTNGSGQVSIQIQDSTQVARISSGSLGGLLREYNQELPATRSRLDQVAQQLIQGVNQVQATGLPTTGPFSSLTGSVSVPDPNAPLATQDLPFSIQPGELVISVTDTATDNRTNTTIVIDPATQSLNDIAAAITTATGGQVQGNVTTPQNQLQLDAQPGFRYDFAGRIPNPPDSLAMGGTATPQVNGVYTGNSNDVYSFQVTGSGTIGQTSGLSLEVRDSSNSVVANLNVGSGYVPGTPIVVGNGVTVQIGSGTTTNGSFSAPLISNSDSSNVLSGLGVNGLFTGADANSISVNPRLLNDPNLLSASRTGQVGDSTNLIRLANVRDQSRFPNGNTINQELADLNAQIGNDVRILLDGQNAQRSLKNNLSAQEQSVVGVDINEEMVNLLTYQRMVESAARYLGVVNQALDEIVNIVR